MQEKEEYKIVASCKHCGEPTQIKYEEMPFAIPRACKCMIKEQQRQEQIENKKKIEEARQKAIPIKKFRDFTFNNDDLKNNKISTRLKRYVTKFSEIKDKGLGLLLFGSVGVGKTFYAYCIANALIDEGYKVVAITLTDVIKIAQNFDKDSDKNIFRMLQNDIILIDDFGSERQTTFAYEQIFNFIDKALSMNKVLILTTNLTLSELEETKQDNTAITQARIYSRILEKCFPIKVEFIDRRDKLKDANREYMFNLLKD